MQTNAPPTCNQFGGESLGLMPRALKMRAAFSREYAACAGVILHASMRLARVFFTDRAYADAELPPFMRVQSQEAAGRRTLCGRA